MGKIRNILPDRNAVSPVIGVMLMIVVTVILSAAVASYTNSMSTQEPAPQATLITSASMQDKYIHIEHMSGDTIDRRYIQVEIEAGYPPQSGYVDIDDIEFVMNANYLNPGDDAMIYFSEIVYADVDQNIDEDYVTFEGDEIDLTIYRGEPFTVTIIDLHSGQTIYSSKITLLP